MAIKKAGYEKREICDYTYVRIRTTHARCQTEERKQNIIYIAGV